MLEFIFNVVANFVQSNFFFWWFPFLFAFGILFVVVKVVYTLVQPY